MSDIIIKEIARRVINQHGGIEMFPAELRDSAEAIVAFEACVRHGLRFSEANLIVDCQDYFLYPADCWDEDFSSEIAAGDEPSLAEIIDERRDDYECIAIGGYWFVLWVRD